MLLSRSVTAQQGGDYLVGLSRSQMALTLHSGAPGARGVLSRIPTTTPLSVARGAARVSPDGERLLLLRDITATATPLRTSRITHYTLWQWRDVLTTGRIGPAVTVTPGQVVTIPSGGVLCRVDPVGRKRTVQGQRLTPDSRGAYAFAFMRGLALAQTGDGQPGGTFPDIAAGYQFTSNYAQIGVTLDYRDWDDLGIALSANDRRAVYWIDTGVVARPGFRPRHAYLRLYVQDMWELANGDDGMLVPPGNAWLYGYWGNSTDGGNVWRDKPTGTAHPDATWLALPPAGDPDVGARIAFQPLPLTDVARRLGSALRPDNTGGAAGSLETPLATGASVDLVLGNLHQMRARYTSLVLGVGYPEGISDEPPDGTQRFLDATLIVLPSDNLVTPPEAAPEMPEIRNPWAFPELVLDYDYREPLPLPGSLTVRVRSPVGDRERTHQARRIRDQKR